MFVDAFLAGLNTQLLAELRWRNIPIATGCTPLRRFWDRADTGAGDRVDDIVGVARLAEPAATLGDADAPAPGGVRARPRPRRSAAQLFLRYPTTLVYLRPPCTAARASTSTGTPTPTAARGSCPASRAGSAADVAFFGFPGFAADDIAAHWLVFEEPPAGYRFANDVLVPQRRPPATTWAAAGVRAAGAGADPRRRARSGRLTR